MTTTQPADPLREALDAALRAHRSISIGDRDWGRKSTVTLEADVFDNLVEAVRTALGDHATLGLAWASVEAALPKDRPWMFEVIRDGLREGDRNPITQHTLGPRSPYKAVAQPSWPPFGDEIAGHGPTPEAALLALHAALTEKKP